MATGVEIKAPQGIFGQHHLHMGGCVWIPEVELAIVLPRWKMDRATGPLPEVGIEITFSKATVAADRVTMQRR